MSDNTGKDVLFAVVGILFFLTIFGVPLGDKLGETNPKFSFLSGWSEGIGEYVFGIKDGAMGSFSGLDMTPYALIVIFMMIWLIIFVTFGDILETFSMFNPVISWLIAFCLSVIGGMTGAYGGYVGWVTNWFAIGAISTIYIGLGFSFVMFLAVQFGLGAFLPWFKNFALQRKLDQQEIKIKSKVIGAANTIEALDEVGKKLAKS